MIEQWILDKIDPLKKNPLIILHDPQRMIRAGAHRIDSWAELYDPVWAIYEKDGFDFESLGEERSLEVEEDYQMCVRRSQ